MLGCGWDEEGRGQGVQKVVARKGGEGGLEESVELDAGRNKEGIESVRRREMKGCVGGRGVGVELKRRSVPSGPSDVHD